MTRKTSDLEEFVRGLKFKFPSTISTNALELEIGKRFGVTDYNIKTTKKQLVKFGFIKETAYPDIWELISYNPKEPKKETEEALAALKKSEPAE